MSPRPRTGALAALLCTALAAAAPRPAAAQSSKADAFAGKIPPVSGQLFRKAGRLEVVAGGAMSLNDAFFTKYFGDVELAYHLTESFSLSLAGAGGLVTRSGSAVRCSPNTGCVDADETMLRQVPGRIRGVTSLGIAWAPVYGKLNVLAEKVAHFDLAILAGVDGVAHDEVLSTEAAALGTKPKLTMAGGFHLGVGAHLFVSEFWAVRVAVKDLVYAVKVPNGASKTDWQNQLFTEIGASFFFPTRNRPQR